MQSYEAVNQALSGVFPAYYLQVFVMFKKDIDVFIPKGTPFVQIIPIKRADWKHAFSEKHITQDLEDIENQAKPETKITDSTASTGDEEEKDVDDFTKNWKNKK